MAANIPYFTLNDGTKMPSVGIGSVVLNSIVVIDSSSYHVVDAGWANLVAKM